jgi:hypothetical protein
VELHPMKLLDRLRRFVESAPPGTLVPVDALRKLLEEEKDNAATAPDRGVTAEEAAEWLHQALGGRKRKPAAVRKLMRTGYRGIVLESFRVGREVRTTEASLERFAGRAPCSFGGTGCGVGHYGRHRSGRRSQSLSDRVRQRRGGLMRRETESGAAW